MRLCLVLAAAAVLSGCRSAAPQPDFDPAFREGRFTFIASLRGEHVTRNGTRPYVADVRGEIEIMPNGDLVLASTHGGCARPARERHTEQRHLVGVNCDGISIQLDLRYEPPTGTVSAMLMEMRARREQCAVYQQDAAGRLGPCLEWVWAETEVLARRTAQARVLRSAGVEP